MHYYDAYGLRIGSAIPLPELSPARRRDVDVTIRCGDAFAPAPPDANHAERQFDIALNEARLFWRHVGTFRVRHGREIVIHPLPGVEEPLLRLALLGPVMAALLHQRRLLLLHASAVAIDGGAVAIVGGKGWGKSTLAAALCARDHGLLADDVVALDPAAAKPAVLPGFPRLKLWPDAVAALGDDPEDWPRLWSRVEKRDLSVNGHFARQATPLRRLYILSQAASAVITRLPPQVALQHLSLHAYVALLDKHWLQAGAAAHFRHCAALVRRIPVYSLARPSSHDLLPAIAHLLEQHAREL